MRLLQAALLASVLFAQDKPPPKGTLSGTVVNSVTGLPLNKVQILGEPVAGQGRLASTTTDAKGNFTLLDLVPGQYRLKGQRNGYSDTFYGARRAEGRGTPITLEAGQEISGLEFKLLPFGVIAGTVREQDGEPLVGAAVTVYRLKFENGRRRLSRVENAHTDDLGQYRIPNLPPGSYYVRAEAKRDAPHALQDQILVPSLFPGGQDQASARPLELSTGARLLGVDITLVRSNGVRVRGRAVAPAGTTLGGISLNYGHAGTAALGLRLEVRADAKGDFMFQAVPPGSYTLTAAARPPARPTNRLFDLFNQPEYKAHVPVQVGSSAVEGIHLAVETGVEVSGSIKLVGDDNPKLRHGVIRFDDGSSEPISAFVNDERQFTAALSPGHYKVHPYLGDLVVQSIRLQGRNILDEGLTITAPGTGPLEILVTRDGGGVTGVVLDKDQKPLPGATVVLVPETKLRFRVELFQQRETDQHGRYQIKTVPPGDYKLFAWDDVEDGLWHDPDFLKRYETRGEKVTVQANRQETAEVHVITTGNPIALTRLAQVRSRF